MNVRKLYSKIVSIEAYRCQIFIGLILVKEE